MAKMMRGVKGARSLFLCYKRGDKTFESDFRNVGNNGRPRSLPDICPLNAYGTSSCHGHSEPHTTTLSTNTH